MFEEYEVGSELQDKVDYYGLRISKEELVRKMSRAMEMNGHECSILNNKYLIVDGEEFQFIKSVKNGKWIVKRFCD